MNAENKVGQTPLHKSALHGQLEVARALIEKGADVNAKNKVGQTPLHYSADNGHLEVARTSIQAGSDVLVMVGDKAVAPAARDRSVNHRKPASGRRAALKCQ